MITQIHRMHQADFLYTSTCKEIHIVSILSSFCSHTMHIRVSFRVTCYFNICLLFDRYFISPYPQEVTRFLLQTLTFFRKSTVSLRPIAPSRLSILMMSKIRCNKEIWPRISRSRSILRLLFLRISADPKV